jgi:hypothetical protein
VVIGNEKNHTFDFNIIFWLYAINQEIFNFNMIIWFYLIYLKSWHQYCWFLAKHCHLVTKQIRLFSHGDYF